MESPAVSAAQVQQQPLHSSEANTTKPLPPPKFADRKFHDGDRFTTKSVERNKETKKWMQTEHSGKVLHLREMYGGPPYTYMVKYDDPSINEHNASENEMTPC